MGDAETRDNYLYMIDTVGWRQLEAHITGRIEYHREQLMHCDSWEQVLEHRHKAEALNSVFLHIKETIRKGEEDIAEI